MIKKAVTIVLIGITIILIGIDVLVYTNEDKVNPVIALSDNVVSYNLDDDPDVLLDGVTATDNKDGDLTSHVAIGKIIMSKNKKTATVEYFVTDEAGNLGKNEKVVEIKKE